MSYFMKRCWMQGNYYVIVVKDRRNQLKLQYETSEEESDIFCYYFFTYKFYHILMTQIYKGYNYKVPLDICKRS